MNEMIHTRGDRWRSDEFPFGSVADLCEFLGEFEKAIVEAAPDPPRKLHIDIRFEQGRIPNLDFGGFCAAAVDVGSVSEISELHASTGYVNPDDAVLAPDFSAHFMIWDGEASLAIEGRRVTAVEGVRAAAKAAIAKAEKKRAAEAVAVRRDEESTVSPPPGNAAVVRSRPWWENPWVVGIGVTLVGSVIAGLIIAAVLGNG